LNSSIASLANAEELDPTDTTSRIYLALSRLEAKGLDTTANELRTIAASDKHTFADLTLVSLYLRAREFDNALKAIDALETKMPKDATPFILRGQTFTLRQDYAGARTAFERALVLDAVNMRAATSLAALDVHDNKPEVARKRFETILAKDPANSSALTALAKLLIHQRSEKEEIVKLLKAAAQASPGDEESRLILVDYHLDKRDAKSALAAAQAAVTAITDNANLTDALGRSQQASGDSNQAIATFGKLAVLEPKSTRAYLRLAGIRLATEDKSGAKRELQRALAVDPRNLAAYQTLFAIARQQKQPNEALAIALSVQKQLPNLPVGYFMEGEAELLNGDKKRASDIYRRLPDRFATTEVAFKVHSALLAARLGAEADKQAQAWIAKHPKDDAFLGQVADVAMARGNLAAAETYFRSLVEIQPENIAALNNMGWILARFHKPGAVGFAEKANKLKPDSAGLLDTLAFALASENRIGEAVSVQKKALSLGPENATVRLNLAKLYLQSGDKAAARAELEQLAKLGHKFAAQPEVAKLLKDANP
jgi:putative PEP-CTERM system TPR-repeat lipoprotein